MRVLLLAFMGFLALPGAAAAQFVGDLVLDPPGCENTETCTLAQGFGFVDSRGIGWEAAAGNITDGASIPRWAQRFVGVPFTPEYVPAAVLHDHYSKTGRPVRGWLETQRMFHEALLASGVPEGRAAVLYAGVLIGSRKWITRMEGRPCPMTQMCIQQVVTLELQEAEPTFGTETFVDTFTAVAAELETMEAVDADAVEALVRARLPADVYLNTPSGVIRSGISFGALATE